MFETPIQVSFSKFENLSEMKHPIERLPKIGRRRGNSIDFFLPTRVRLTSSEL